MTTRTSTGRNGEIAEPLRYVRIYSDSLGMSHFSDEDMSFSLVNFSPDLPPVSAARPIPATRMVVLSAPARGVADWHTVPRKQFNLILHGEVEIEVRDGEVRRFRSGSLILAEDTEGKGHITRVVSKDDAYFAVVALEEA